MKKITVILLVILSGCSNFMGATDAQENAVSDLDAKCGLELDVNDLSDQSMQPMFGTILSGLSKGKVTIQDEGKNVFLITGKGPACGDFVASFFRSPTGFDGLKLIKRGG